MYKNILIMGPGRAGKTTLAKMISKKYGYSIISIDSIVSALEELPEIQKAWKGSSIETCKRIAPFLIKYINEVSEGKTFYEGHKYVIEGSDVDIDHVIPNINRETNLLIGLTYNDLTIQEMFNNLRQYDTEADWTHYLNDQKLAEYSNYCINSNKVYNSKFKEHDISNFDVTLARDAVLRAITDNLEDFERGKNDLAKIRVK